MTVDYRAFRAHPTMYRGIKFRSRLEATWAAFFDGLAWPWEYEPIDLNGWVPDFLLRGKEGEVLVEIKPVDFTDADVQQKMLKASEKYDADLMIGGRQPKFETEIFALVSTFVRDRPNAKWSGRMIIQLSGKYDMLIRYKGFQTGLTIGRAEPIDEYVGREVAALWARAKNTTQWRPPRMS